MLLRGHRQGQHGCGLLHSFPPARNPLQELQAKIGDILIPSEDIKWFERSAVKEIEAILHLNEEIWVKPGESADLSCRSEYLTKIYPHISTRWMKDDVHIRPGEFIKVFPNGALRLSELRMTDSGVYVCQGKVPLQEGAVSVNIVRLHVGSSIQEELMKQGGPWLSSQNSFGIPNAWVASFIGSLTVCVAFWIILVAMRQYFKVAMKKYKKKATPLSDQS